MHADSSPVYPLTRAQRGLWVANKLYTENTLMLSEALELFGPLDPKVMLRASAQVTREFDTLRLCIDERGGLPVQIVLPEYTGTMPYFNMAEDPAPRNAAEHWIEEQIRKPEDLRHGPLWFCALFRLGEDHHLWVQYMSHVVMDGYTTAMVVQRVAALYSAYVIGAEPEAADFASATELVALEHQYRESDRYQRDGAYWKAQLADLPTPATLARLGTYEMAGALRGTGSSLRTKCSNCAC